MPTQRILPWFWDLLEKSERNLDSLAQRLGELPQDDLRNFQGQYEAAKIKVNPGIPGAMEGVNSAGLDQECSEDGGDDFADWVVSQGQPFYEQVRTQPEQIDKHLRLFSRHENEGYHPEMAWDTADNECDGYQSPGLIAYAVYRRRFGLSLSDELDL